MLIFGQLRWLFLGTLAVLLVVSNLVEPAAFGVSAEWSNGHYRFAGGTAPWALLFAGLIVLLYLLLIYAEPSELGQPLPGVFRRFVAFWIDFLFAVFGVAPILGIVPLIVEWRKTRVFQWTFEREIPARGDGLIATVSILLMFATLIFYYALPLVRRKPSPGTCVLGYQIVAEDGTAMSVKKAVLRTLLGFIAVCSAYLAPFVARDRQKGKFWLDRVFGTQAVRLS